MTGFGVALQRGSRAGLTLGHPGRRCGDARLAQQHRGHRFVHRPLDGASAVADRHFHSASACSRPRRKVTCSKLPLAISRTNTPSGSCDSKPGTTMPQRFASRSTRQSDNDAKPPPRPRALPAPVPAPPVPARLVGQDGDARCVAHSPNDSARRTPSRAPPRKSAPEARLHTRTSAGANSIGSMR